ncbi:hypothetical protein AKJ41_05790 [candidate division MSBL1 archaeon SCGC-AAA259O05]|uniref:Uncharacterized protein n=1 Tax=candidate division MSBL1 archaeon SCGC-AAA259O05 TaxID=1698271 RepID=A0A133UYD9_9EURY|nr:hypothetical protein AKJ41_05790 [candidate division MSBL1 archaeon SCGC-AAA259O05]
MSSDDVEKSLVVIGLIFGSIILASLFSPWMKLSSSPYRAENKNLTTQDTTTITGYDLMVGKYKVKRRNFSTEEVLQVKELKGPSKFYTLLVLVGGLLILSGGIIGLYPRRRLALILMTVGSILAFTGAFWCIIDTHWIRLRSISFGSYAFFGYWRYGLIVILGGSLSCSIGTIISTKV